MKKVISLILTICMLTALLPTVAFASEGSAESTASIVADFTKTGKTRPANPYSFVVEDGFKIVTEKTTTKNVGAKWDGQGLQFCNYLYSRGTTAWPADKSANQMFTVNVEAEKAGYYSTEFVYEAFSKSGEYSVYINGQFAGAVDAYDTNFAGGGATDIRTQKLNTVFLKKGTNEVSFRCTKHYREGGTWFILDKLTLTYFGEELSVKSISHALPEEIYAGRTANFDVSVKMSDGSTKFFGKYNDAGKEITEAPVALSVISGDAELANLIQTYNGISGSFKGQGKGTVKVKVTVKTDVGDFEDIIDIELLGKQPLASVVLSLDKTSLPATRTTLATISVFDTNGDAFVEYYDVLYESLNENVATVTVGENKNEAIITGISEGKATIKVTVTADGVSKTDEKEIIISKKPTVGKLILTTDKNTYQLGQEGTFAVAATMSDGSDATEAELAELEFTYENDNEEVISLNASEKKFTAIASGNAEISAVAEIGGEKIYGRKVVNVIAEGDPIVANFAITVLGEGNTYTGAITNGFTINTEKSTAKGVRVKLDGVGLQVTHYVTPLQYEYVWPKVISKDLMFTVNIVSEKAGYYSPEFIYEAYNKGGEYAIYINEQYAGVVNAFDATQKKGVERKAQLNTVYLKEGINEVSFKCTWHGRRADSSWLILDKLTLTPCGDTLSVKKLLHNIPERMCKGQTVDFTVSAEMSDSSAKVFGKYNEDGTANTDTPISLSITSESGEITDVEKVSEGLNGRLTTKESGIVAIKAEANIDGTLFEDTFEVEVLDAELHSTRPDIQGTVFKDDVIELKTVNTLTNGEVWDIPASYTVFTSSNDKIAKIDGNTLTALGTGTVTITATTTLAGVTKEGSIDISIIDEDVKTLNLTAGGSMHLRLTGIEGDTVPMYIEGVTNKGAIVEIDNNNAEITYEVLTPEIATIDGDGNITPISAGDAKFKVTVLFRGRTIEGEATFASAKAKSHSTYYTTEKKANAVENISKYSWAKSEAKTAIEKADACVDKIDLLYGLVTSNGIPRSFSIGEYGDPEMWYCTYCGCDIQEKYGAYKWNINPVSRPWKIQCPDCKRLFPSNDFESFYELGLNEYGEFSRERALLRHHKKFVCKDGENCKCVAPAMSEQTHSDGKLNRDFYDFYGYGVDGGYLHNDLYEDVADEKTVNRGRGIVAENGEDPSFWGVDDSFGYLTGYKHTDANGTLIAYERHSYIPVYAHSGLYYHTSAITNAISNCSQAYIFTGEKKYGRVAAILLDRIADFYPDYDLTEFYKIRRSIFMNSDGGNKNGKILGNIWENGAANNLCIAYDAVYEMYDDPEVLKFIQNKGKVIKFRHAKETPSQIRTNIEDGILRTAFTGLSNGSVAGNFGHDQRLNARLAVVLDSQPETTQWLEYLMAPGWKQMQAGSTGGSLLENLYNKVDWDGQGNEASSYNAGWLGYLMGAAFDLADYENSGNFNIFENPKFAKMFYGMLKVTMTDYGIQTGDSGTFAGKGEFWLGASTAMAAYKYFGDEVFLQALYTINGYSVSGIHEDIYTKNPEQIQEDIKRVIQEKGTLSLEPEMLSGFGFAALRDGKRYSKEDDTRHGFWTVFGLTGVGHGNRDTLNLGMDAFGLNFMPDLGYPTTADSQPRPLQWDGSTLSHNTVMVNEKRQGGSLQRGKSLHFDSTENVQLFDVDAPDVYNTYDDTNVSTYRRSVIMVKIDEDNFYGLDLFRVKGGWSHELSLHAQSDEIGFTSGVNFVPQVDENGKYKGNYAGIDVDSDLNSEGFAGPDPNSPIQATYETVYPRGYTWLENVDRGTPTSDKVELDFNIKDFKKAIVNSKGLHLRATMLGIEPDSMINTATGYAPKKPENSSVPGIRYAFVKRKSEDKKTELDTLFTTVYEPYRNERTLSDISELQMTVSAGSEDPEDDIARCIKVTHADGERVDYIFYATNNKVTYTVTDGDEKFTFRGFVGVITMNNGADIYKYICDGDILNEAVPQKKAINARVTSFTESLEFENEIRIKPLQSVSADEISSLAGRYVYVENGNIRNAAYKIESAKQEGEEIVLDIGDCTLITGQIDPYAEDKVGNYTYNIAKRADCVIPLSWSENNAPWVNEVSDKTVSAGSSLSFAISGGSPIENMETSLSLRTAPRGASLNSDTGAFSWKPDASQVGTHVITVTVTDVDGRQSVRDFKVEVYGSTTGSKTETTDNNTEGSESSGGGGGGGGGAAPTDKPDTETKPDDAGSTDKTDIDDETDNSNTDVGNGVYDVPNFTDLGNHTWATDAINTLATDGIIRGTSESTFSPANNIIRADFALLLVRAFNLTSDNTENFTDVSANDYFATELAIARNNGIVGGIGENKFAPRNTITRQDMMVIVYRALQNLNVGLGDFDEPKNKDFTTVAPYAKDAVSALIANGIVNGKSGLIAPLDYTTRAEVAVLLKRILDYTQK